MSMSDWRSCVVSRLVAGRLYSHKDLAERIKLDNPYKFAASYHSAINAMVRDKILLHTGYNEYCLAGGATKAEYVPLYSEAAMELSRKLAEEFPFVQFTVFETLLLNDFLTHLMAQNSIFIQVEKESSKFLFRFLQEQGYQNILYKPPKKDFELYWLANCVVVTDLISEAPMSLKNPHSITLEKMLVDICADKLIASTYEGAEFAGIMEQARELYRIDKTRLLRYARRRNRENDLKRYFSDISDEVRQ